MSMFVNAPRALNDPECWKSSSLKTILIESSPNSAPSTSRIGVRRMCGRITLSVCSNSFARNFGLVAHVEEFTWPNDRFS